MYNYLKHIYKNTPSLHTTPTYRSVAKPQNGVVSYRFAFNGMERDDEVSGSGNSYTTHFRQLDTRLGRWFSVDPVFQPWQTTYGSMDNNPIMFNDPLGDIIQIRYRDNVTGKMMNFTYTFNKTTDLITGEELPDSDFLRKVIGRLNFLVRSGADVTGVIERTSSKDVHGVLIKELNLETDYLIDGNSFWGGMNTIYWDPNYWLCGTNDDNGLGYCIPPSVQLLHELGHFRQELDNPKIFDKGSCTFWQKKWEHPAEKDIVLNVETPAMEKLGLTPRTTYKTKYQGLYKIPRSNEALKSKDGLGRGPGEYNDSYENVNYWDMRPPTREETEARDRIG